MGKYDYALDLSDGSSCGKIMRKICPNSIVLEFGCAEGRMTQYMAEQLNCQVYIVEIDHDAFQKAEGYAKDGVCGDAETLTWFQKFCNISFDYIIFADVLEHLCNPQMVLRKAQELLKENGSILISIPNIAHGDIVSNLMQNRFEYTNTGLLDDTHIHFWGHEDFAPFAEATGLSIVEEDAVYYAVGCTEQALHHSTLPQDLRKYVIEKEYSTVYQFIYELKKQSSVYKYNIAFVSKIKDVSGPNCTVFFDCGDGYTIANSTQIIPVAMESGKIAYYLDTIPEKCVSIRYDPVEGRGVILSGLEIVSDYGELEYVPINGSKVENEILFCDTDPQISISLNEKIKWIRIEVSAMRPVSDTAFLEEFLNRIRDFEQNIRKMDQTIAEQRTLLQKGEEEKKEIHESTLKYAQDEYQSQLSKKQDEYQSQLAKRQDEYQKRLLKVRDEYQSLLTQTRDEHRRILESSHNAYKQELQEICKQKDEILVSVLKDTHEGFNKQICRMQDEYEGKLRDLRSSYEQQIQSIKNDKQELQSTLTHYQTQYHIAIEQREILKSQVFQSQDAYNAVVSSVAWKLAMPIRVSVKCIKKALNVFGLLSPLRKVKDSLRTSGLKETLKKIVKKCFKKKDKCNQNIKFSGSLVLTENERVEQSAYPFEQNVLFSIVVPLYNTPMSFLQDMVQSVLSQTYTNWELCLADGSDANYKELRKACHSFAKSDSRIKYKKLQKNGGISVNTIEAYSLSHGDYIVLLDHDDILTENALFECAKCVERFPDVDFIYSDKGIFLNETGKILAYHYLPDYSPEFLRATNYASHLNLFSRRIIDEVGFIREGYDGSQDYDLELRVAEKARRIEHIAKVLYYCRACEGSVALNPESKMYAYEAGRRAIEEHIQRIGYPGEVEFIQKTFSYRIHYEIVRSGKVSIIIPNMDHLEELSVCVDSILNNTDYPDYEIVIVENNSQKQETFDYYERISKNSKVKVLYYQPPFKEFNFSAINNFAVTQVESKYVLFLNNDTKVINRGWLREMLMFAQRDDVGAVGAELFYPTERYQHIGLFIGIGEHIATHYAHNAERGYTGYMHRLSMPQNYNAVTGACMLMKRDDFIAVNGFDEIYFKVGLNDVDICLKLRSIGKVNVFTPYAELYHYESVSRKSDDEGPNKIRFKEEQTLFRGKWAEYFKRCDEYYNVNLNL